MIPRRDATQVAPSPMTDLLDELFSADAMAQLAASCGALEAAGETSTDPIPHDLWESALLGPVRDMLSRPGKRFRANLVALTWRLGGATEPPPGALPLLVEIVHAGSLVVDDIEDDSAERRGRACLHRLHGVPLALNVGNWMYFWPLQLVETLGLPADRVDQLRPLLTSGMFRCHFGQSLDLALPIGRLPRRVVPSLVATSTALKTGALMEMAARLGAVAAGATAERVLLLARFGQRLGIGLQMLDDLGNLAPRALDARPADKFHEDLRLGRPTWPWAWAAEQLDDVGFASLQADARVVQAQHLAGRRPDTEPLAAHLRGAIGLAGRMRTRRYLERAMNDLEQAIGPVPEMRLVTDEIERLEVAYG